MEKLNYKLNLQMFAGDENSSVEILNAIRSVASDEYQARIPEATRTNIASVGNTILSYTPTTNMFLTELLNRIGRVVIKKLDTMPDIYGVFGEERLEFGDTIQKIFIDIPSAHAFEGTATLTPASMLAIEKGKIHVEYTKVDRKLYYKTTISVAELKEAFVNVSALDSFVMGLIEGMARAFSVDKYVMDTRVLGEQCKYVKSLKDQVASANVRVIEVPASVAKYNKTSGQIEWDTVGAKAFLKQLRKETGMLQFYHKLDYCPFDMTNEVADVEDASHTSLVKTISAMRTPRNKQILGLEVSSLAEIDVDALAVLFNLDKAELQTQVIELEDGAFGLYGSSTAERYIGGFLCNRDAVERGISFEDSDSFKNPEHEYVNFWNHYWGYRAVSKFADFCPIVFTAYTPA